MATCETCRWWQPEDLPGRTTGMCRRLPPQLPGIDPRNGADAWWPETDGNDWCGEHAPRDGGEE